MEDIKQVNVTLTLQDEKALSRTNKSGTRRRKNQSAGSAEIVGSVKTLDPETKPEPVVPKQTPEPVVPKQTPEPLVVKTVQEPKQVPEPVPTPVTPVKPKQHTEEVKAPVIKIQTKKPIEKPLAPRIIHTKKRTSSVPTVAQKKLKFVVPTALSHSKLADTGSKLKPAEEGVKKQGKRNYTERKISIEVKPSESARKFKQTLKRKISQMPIALVKKELLSKGIIKPKKGGKYPPDEMLRSMMKDYISLHAAE